MVTSTCLQFSSLKCLIGVSLCFTLHSAVSHVNDRGQVGPGPQHLPTHNTSALLNDSFPLHDVAQKSELDIDAGVEDARGLLPDSIISTARNRLDTFLDTFRPELSVLRTPLLSNGIEHGHSSVEHDGNALRSDLSSGVKDVIVYERDDGIASAVNKIGRSEKEVDDKAKKRMFDLLEVEVRSKKQDSELLSIIQRGQSSEDESVTSFYDFALLHMLKHKNSAQVVHEKWVKDGVIIKEIRRFLQKHVLDTVPFFKSNMASLLLSHVGYCWKHKSGELTVEELLEYFEQIKLMEDDVVRMAVGARRFFGGQDAIDQMQNVLIDRPGTQHLAFRMEMNGIKGLEHFSKSFSPYHLSDLWLKYAAFALDCNSIVEENASHFLLLNFFEQKYEQIKTLERFLQAYKAYEVEPKAPLTPNDQNQGVVFRLNREESDQEILTRESQSNYLIYKFAKDMLKYVRELKDPGLY